jgi:hypothetical protein
MTNAWAYRYTPNNLAMIISRIKPKILETRVAKPIIPADLAIEARKSVL